MVDFLVESVQHLKRTQHLKILTLNEYEWYNQIIKKPKEVIVGENAAQPHVEEPRESKEDEVSDYETILAYKLSE